MSYSVREERIDSYTTMPIEAPSITMAKVAHAFAWLGEMLRLQRAGGRKWQRIVDMTRTTMVHAAERGSLNRAQRRAQEARR